MPKLNLALVALGSLGIGWFVGTVAPWWVTALMIGGAVSYVLVRRRSS